MTDLPIQTDPAALPPLPDETAEPTLRQRQRDAIQQLFALAAECDRSDGVHQAGKTAREQWLAWRYDTNRKRIAARESALKEKTSQRDAGREELLAKQKDRLDANRREADSLIAQAEQRNKADLAKVDQEEQNDRTSAGKQHDDRRDEADKWQKQRNADADQWLAQLAALREQRNTRLSTFPKPLLRNTTDDVATPPIQSPDAEPAARTQAEQWLQKSVDAVRRMHKYTLPHALFGMEPYLWGAIGLAIGAAVGYGVKLAQPAWNVSSLNAVLIGLAGGAVFDVLAAVVCYIVARRQVSGSRRETAVAFAALAAAAAHYRTTLQAHRDKWTAEADAVFEKKTARLDEHYAKARRKALNKAESAMSNLRSQIDDKFNLLEIEQRDAVAAYDHQTSDLYAHLTRRLELRKQAAEQRRDRDRVRLQGVYERAQAALLAHWTAERDRILAVLDETLQIDRTSNKPWVESHWTDWRPPASPAPAVRFGSLKLGPAQLLDPAQREGVFDPRLPPDFAVPAVLASPGQRNLLIQTANAAGREVALDTLRSTMTRLLTTLPAGLVKFTMIDPVGLGQTFAGFMHLADYDESLVNTRIWSEPEQIDQRLVDLTDHLSYVIQKHLRNKFATIDEYNEQAGQLAEPYRFVVVADYPHRLSPAAVERLHAIVASGAHCGVFVLAVQDLRQDVPAEMGKEHNLAEFCTTIKQVDSDADSDKPRFEWDDAVFGKLPLTLDAAPGERVTSEITTKVGAAAIDAGRVQLPFATITPPLDKLWSKSSAEELAVPVGKAGATRLQSLVLGHGVAQHALIAGKTGSGKSSLLHALITNLALWYSPDELEFYLIDFKKGVEFKPYVTQKLPHARAIAIESDRIFGLSILRKLDKQMDQRGELFRRTGAQNIAGYRAAHPDQFLPRTLLIVDEFQELFSQDDDIALQAASLLDRLVRQGRAFGMHALLGSQSLSGAAGLAMGTMSQMAIRIALMCGEADSQLILSDDNTAARLLSRPGEGIYNAQGGVPTANVFFQVAWLPEETHRKCLEQVYEADQAQRGDAEARPCVVFEGSTPADLSTNVPLRKLLAAPDADPHRTLRAYVGDPIAIDDPAAFELLRTAGANGLIVGQQAESALAVTASAVLSLAAQHHADEATFVILNGSPEPEHAGYLQRVVDLLPHDVKLYNARQAPDALPDLHAQLQTRLADTSNDADPIYLVVFALQRFRDLRKSEEEFSFSSDPDAPAKPAKLDKQFTELLTEGPAVGIHSIVWCDRAGALEQSIDRRDLRAFDQRLLFQMSATDSALLIDGADANQLGPFRALLARDDRGTMQVLRPYGWPSAEWMRRFSETLRKREADRTSVG